VYERNRERNDGGTEMKAVLISIKPKWCELIASGKKTVEVRKSKPKLETPFKVYIYCTKGDSLNYLKRFHHKAFDKFWIDNKAYGANVARANGKVIGEFVCDEIITASVGNYCRIPTSASQVDAFDLLDYADGKTIYGWHISNLVIYDKPRELSEFAKPAKTAYDDEGYLLCDGCEFANWNIERVCTIDFCPERMITRPPQSWGYVESEAEDNPEVPIL
jgi:predicted transcriptional regulator